MATNGEATPKAHFWTQVFAAVAALGAVAVSILNSYKINEVHVLMNSRLDELLDLTTKAATAAGFKAGQESKPGPDPK